MMVNISVKHTLSLVQKRYLILKRLRYSNVTGKKINYVNVSEEDTRVGLKAMGWDDWLIDTTLQLFDLYRKGVTSRVSSEVQGILGRRPISFTEFAKDYAQAFR